MVLSKKFLFTGQGDVVFIKFQIFHLAVVWNGCFIIHLFGNAPICASTVLEYSCCKIHCYVAAPFPSPLFHFLLLICLRKLFFFSISLSFSHIYIFYIIYSTLLSMTPLRFTRTIVLDCWRVGAKLGRYEDIKSTVQCNLFEDACINYYYIRSHRVVCRCVHYSQDMPVPVITSVAHHKLSKLAAF